MARVWGIGRKLPKSSAVGSQNKFLHESPTATDGVEWVDLDVTPNATEALYTPAVTGNWTGADPTTVAQALDRLAAACVAASHTP
jgi:hypothetical protein